MFKCSKCHFEIKRRLENCGAMQMETMNITAKIQPTTCVLALFSANADVKIPLFLNVKIVQAYSDTSFLWRGFEITKPSVCCHLLLLWKWICQVSWKQVSNKPLLWKIMYNFCWWCHPSITVHLPPRSSQLVPVSSVGKALSFSTRISAAYAHPSLVVGLLGTRGCALDATHTHFHVALSPPWHRGDTWAHLHSNPACKGQVTPSSCPSEDRQIHFHWQTGVSLAEGDQKDKQKSQSWHGTCLFSSVYTAVYSEMSYSVSSAHEGALRIGIHPVWDSFGCIIPLFIGVNKEQYI